MTLFFNTFVFLTGPRALTHSLVLPRLPIRDPTPYGPHTSPVTLAHDHTPTRTLMSVLPVQCPTGGNPERNVARRATTTPAACLVCRTTALLTGRE